MVEFALVVPILLLLLIGVIEFGWFINIHIKTENAAREGARALSLNQNPAAADLRIDAALTNGSTTFTHVTEFKESTDNGGTWSGTDIAVANTTENNAASGNLIRSKVTVTHSQLTGFIPGLDNFSIIKYVVMVKE